MTYVRCGGRYGNCFYCRFLAESISDRILKIGQHLPGNVISTTVGFVHINMQP